MHASPVQQSLVPVQEEPKGVHQPWALGAPPPHFSKPFASGTHGRPSQH
jgi:hypothetical protein